MPYQVRNKKNGDGSYALNYGRGKQKLQATMTQTDEGWCVVDGDGAGVAAGCHGVAKMKDCKAAWGEWAEKNYGKSGSKDEVESPPTPSSPTPPTTPAPPTFKQATPEPELEALGHKFAADPFDPRFKEDKRLTPLGVLVEIKAWCERHANTIKKVETEVYPQAPFRTLLEQVDFTLQHECPDLFTPGDTDEPTDTPAPIAGLTPAGLQSAIASGPAGPPPPPTFLGTDRDGNPLEDDDIPF